jgi:hypothetical protein
MEKIDRHTYNILTNIVASYDKWKKNIEEQVNAIYGGGAIDCSKPCVKSSKLHYDDSNINAMERANKIRNGTYGKYVQAMEKTMEEFTLDFEDRLGKRIVKAITLNCTNRHRFSYASLIATMDLYMADITLRRYKLEFLNRLKEYLEM